MQPRDPGRSTVRVLVADDQAIVREGLVTLLGMMPDIDVVAAASDGEQAITLTAEHDPDVVLMDLGMPRLDGTAATRRIRRDHPRTQVVVLTTFAEEDAVITALQAGAVASSRRTPAAQRSPGRCTLRPPDRPCSTHRSTPASWPAPQPRRTRRPPHPARPCPTASPRVRPRSSPDRRRVHQRPDRRSPLPLGSDRQTHVNRIFGKAATTRPCTSRRLRPHS